MLPSLFDPRLLPKNGYARMSSWLVPALAYFGEASPLRRTNDSRKRDRYPLGPREASKGWAFMVFTVARPRVSGESWYPDGSANYTKFIIYRLPERPPRVTKAGTGRLDNRLRIP